MEFLKNFKAVFPPGAFPTPMGKIENFEIALDGQPHDTSHGEFFLCGDVLNGIASTKCWVDSTPIVKFT